MGTADDQTKMTDGKDDTSVRVAIRIRPQSAKERLDMCQVCTSVLHDENQVFLGKDKAFTYDHVFDIDTTQDIIYDNIALGLIEGTFEGYNATIFAYGQTGSGKTYTMGTGFDLSITQVEVGIIPRAVEHLFNGIDKRRREALEKNEPVPDFKVNAQFMELYNEEIHDLLDTTRDPSEKGRKSHIKIHEDASGEIYTVGVTTRTVSSLQDTIQCLKVGALSRTTGSTMMNAQSSRSHAIFTLHIKQQRVAKVEPDEEAGEEGGGENGMEKSITNEFETLTAKFHFVDLAGSERLKRTGATGDRAKEGISINCGLLALGNVISALGDKMKKGSHVPYRDSKLTRLLQDSLGGNSRTLMIACVSPSDRDFMETLNTMKYANRARNIKNKVVVNQDKTSKQIAALRLEIQDLQLELLEYKTGKRMVGEDGVETVNDMFHENTMLQTENNNLRQRIKAMQSTVETLTMRNTQLLVQHDIANLPKTEGGDIGDDHISKMVEGYVREIEELRSKLLESEAALEMLKRNSLRATSRAGASPMIGVARPMTSASFETTVENHAADLIEVAKKDLKRLKKKTKRFRSTGQESDKENQSDEESKTGDGDAMTSSVMTSSVTSSITEDKEEDEDDEEDEDNDEDDNEDDEELEELSSGESDTEDSDSDDESPYRTDVLHENLADLTCDISIKEKLVEELEMSQRRLQAMRTQYEDKLQVLEHRIRQTEQERDRVLGSMGSNESAKSEKAQKVREEYQKKLNDMTSELKKLQAARKEHAKLLRNQAQYERQLGTLQRDLADMKIHKVKLMNQIKEESQKSRQSELRRQKEVAQLRKVQRTKDTQISRLEADKRQKEMVLRRKQEEVELLRKKQLPLSAKAAGRVGKYEYRPPPQVSKPVRRKTKEFSPKVAKQKWDHLEKTVSSIILKKQTLSHMEKDMERWLKERDYVTVKLEKFVKKKEDALVAETPDQTLVSELSEQIDTLRDNISYVQDNITDCQSYIMQYEETKEEDPATVMAGISVEESKYLLQHVLDMVISKGLLASQKETENKELMAKFQQQKNEHDFAVQMCHYMVQQNPEQYGIILDQNFMKERTGDSDTGSGSSSGAASPVDSLLESAFQPINPLTVAMLAPSGTTLGSTSGSGESLSGRNKDKARRKTATTAELLYAGPIEPSSPLLPVPETPEETTKTAHPLAKAVPDTSLMPPPKVPPPASLTINKPSTAGITVLKTTSPLTPGSAKTSSPLTPTVKAQTPGATTPTAKGSVPLLGASKTAAPQASKSVAPTVTAPGAKAPQSTNTVTARQNGAMSRSFTGSLPDPSPSPSLMRKSYPAPAKSALPEPSPSPSMMRKSYPAPAKSAMPEPSPTMRRKANSSSSSLSRQSSICSDMGEANATPPSSPSTTRKSRDGNVFSRLTSNSYHFPLPNRGSINPVTPKPVASKTNPLVHSATAEGHTKAVLSVFATEDLLFSSSKDRTAKVWDLQTGEEILTLEGHPNNVAQVRYSEETKLAFTASTYFVKVWDVREGQKCIKTLVSSGMLIDGPLQINTSSRQVSCPAGETQINDIQLNSTGSVLYSAAGNTVRIWDMRMFKPVGKLSGGHQAAVMVLAVDDTDTADGNICVVTGSKDHYIKVFEMEEDSVGMMTPKYNLEPPHYDGIQSLCLAGDLLFSGSRDTCIKKWDLAEQKLQQSINNSHKDWICGLAFMPGGNCLLSGCRGGFLKIWNIDNCQQLGEIHAHKSPINAITTNSNLIFTASNDRTVSLWKTNNIFDASDLSEND